MEICVLFLSVRKELGQDSIACLTQELVPVEMLPRPAGQPTCLNMYVVVLRTCDRALMCGCIAL